MKLHTDSMAMGVCPDMHVQSISCGITLLKPNISSILPAYTDQLNQAILAFDIDQIIGQLNNVSDQLNAGGQSSLAMQVDAIVQGLQDIRDTQIPTIQNQTVSIVTLYDDIGP